jgi:hypothetical protein
VFVTVIIPFAIGALFWLINALAQKAGLLKILRAGLHRLPVRHSSDARPMLASKT